MERRRRGAIPDVLLVTEHPPVFTLGRTALAEHLLMAPARLVESGAEVVETDRGGDVTFHGPGQLVAYPIFDLAGWRKDLHAYLRALEQVVLDTAAGFGVPGCRREGFTGVWCGGEKPPASEPRKLASIGVRVSRWIASHGFALDVATDLEWFSHIVPCGIRGCRATTLEAEAGRRLSLAEVTDGLVEAFGAVFRRRVEPAPSRFAAALAGRGNAA